MFYWKYSGNAFISYVEDMNMQIGKWGTNTYSSNDAKSFPSFSHNYILIIILFEAECESVHLAGYGGLDEYSTPYLWKLPKI